MDISLKKIFFQVRSFLRSIIGRPIVGGLEVADTGLRYAIRTAAGWELIGLRLPAEVMREGRILDAAVLAQSLQALRTSIFRNGLPQRSLPVVITLSSAPVYTQVFTLPPLPEKELTQALFLNMQVISPVDIKEAYSGYEILSGVMDGTKVEVLSAFARQDLIDGLSETLQSSGFLPIAAESKGLSYARLFRSLAPDYSPATSYVLLIADGDGLSSMVVRNGALYFEFVVPWSDLQAEERDLGSEAFRAVLRRSLAQVTNYYGQHWKEPALSGVYVSLGAATEAAASFLQEASVFPVHSLILPGTGLSAGWFAAVGAGLRGILPRYKDEEVSVIGRSAKEDYFQRELAGLLDFWRVLTPGVLGMLLILLLVAQFGLSRLQADIQQKIAQHSSLGPAQEITALEKQAGTFNMQVASILQLQQTSNIKSPVLDHLTDVMEQFQITPWSFSLSRTDERIPLSGSAPTDTQILNFEHALEKDPMFADVVFSITSIKPQEGAYSFSINFRAIFPAAAKTSANTL